MPGRIDDVELVVLVDDRGALGHDSDAALFFYGVRVHGALVVELDARLFQEAIHQGSFAMIDVGNDGKVSNLLGVLIR